MGDRWGLGFAYRGLAIISQAQGDHLQAVDKFRESLDILRQLGARQDVARVLAEMGRSVFALGNDAEAKLIWRDSLRIAIETRGTFIALEALLGLASLQAIRGDVEQAFELLWIVLEHPATIQDTANRAAQLRIEWEAQLTKQQVEAAQARAQAKTLEVAIEEILKQTERT